jgi:DNA-binding Lrp family transcriptional regulator
MIDLTASGDEVLAVLVGDAAPRERLVFRQLPATTSVTFVQAATVMHRFSDASGWRLPVLTDEERAALAPPSGPAVRRELDEVDTGILGVLEQDVRVPARAIAGRLGEPESTVRRRLPALRAGRQFVTQTFVDPRHLGPPIDANVLLQVPPGRLDAEGRHLDAHPAVHGAFATTGAFNLHAAVWLEDLEHLYRFVTGDLARIGATAVDTALIGRSVKRPGLLPRSRA